MKRLLLAALLLLQVVCLGASEQGELSPAPPGHVRFQSLDYKNVLHWSSVRGNSSLRFNVQWKIYGEPGWLNADACQGIKKRQCDLSSVTSDLREWYYARVQATSTSSSSSSKWILSPRFSPRWDTKLSPPSLQLNVTQQGVVVQLSAALLKVRSDLTFRLFIIDANGKEEVMEFNSQQLLLQKLQHRKKFCFQLQTLLLVQSSARSRRKCVIAP